MGFSLKRLQQVVDLLEKGPEPMELVRYRKQKIEQDTAVVELETLQAGKSETGSLDLVREGDGWVIAEPHRSEAARTMADVRALATAIEAYAVDNNVYPRATTVDQLLPFLVPTYIASLPAVDAWGTPLQYRVSADGTSYRIVSAGSDRTFQPDGSTPQGKSSGTEDDLIYENGTFLAWWEERDK